MSISTPFIHRPVATTLFLLALTLAGAIAYTLLPVSALPEVDFPTINVQASLPGASPDVMAASVATPLEKQFTRIAGVRRAGGYQRLGRFPSFESSEPSQIPEDQSGRPADPAVNAGIGCGAATA